MPAVSTRTTGRPRRFSVSSMVSRVVPGTGVTMARLCAQQGVEQAALAHVGPADDGRAHPLAVEHAPIGRRQQPLDTSRAPRCTPRQRLFRRDVVLGEVDRGRQVGQHLQRQTPGGADPAGQAPVQLPHGQAQAGLGARLHHVQHGLGLVQAEAAVEKGAGGELAGAGQAGALRQAQRQDALQGTAPPWPLISAMSSRV